MSEEWCNEGEGGRGGDGRGGGGGGSEWGGGGGGGGGGGAEGEGGRSRARSGAPRAPRTFLAFIRRFTHSDYNSDMEDIESYQTHQVSVSESSPVQSYDLRRVLRYVAPRYWGKISKALPCKG